MNEQMQQLVALLVLAAMSGDKQANAQVQLIMQAAKKGDLQAAQLALMIQQVAQQMQGGTPAAKRGAKLNYLLTLNNPNYFKKGGKVCPKCEEMKKKNKKLAKGGISDAVNAFKSSRSR